MYIKGMHQLNERFRRKMLPQTLNLPGLQSMCPQVFPIKYGFNKVHQQVAFLYYIHPCKTTLI